MQPKPGVVDGRKPYPLKPGDKPLPEWSEADQRRQMSEGIIRNYHIWDPAITELGNRTLQDIFLHGIPAEH